MTTDSRTTGVLGLSWPPRGTREILVTISWPSTTSPKMVWLPVSQGVGGDGDKELAAVGSGAAVGHGQLAGLVELVRRALGLVAEAVAGPAHAGAGGVAALDHEVGNDAMEDGAVEELVGGLFAGGGVGPLFGALGQFDEVLDGDGRVGLKEPDGDLAFGGGEDGVGSCCECHENSWIVSDNSLNS